jgi:hypothetical protein
MEDGRELDRDVTTADDQHALGELIEEEDLVGADGMFVTGKFRDVRPAACGDQNVLGTMPLPVNFDVMAIDEASMAFEELHAAVYQ